MRQVRLFEGARGRGSEYERARMAFRGGQRSRSYGAEAFDRQWRPLGGDRGQESGGLVRDEPAIHAHQGVQGAGLHAVCLTGGPCRPFGTGSKGRSRGLRPRSGEYDDEQVERNNPGEAVGQSSVSVVQVGGEENLAEVGKDVLRPGTDSQLPKPRASHLGQRLGDEITEIGVVVSVGPEGAGGDDQGPNGAFVVGQRYGEPTP